MNSLLKEFRIELIRNDLSFATVSKKLGISKPTLIKRIKNPELFTIENLKNLKKLNLNVLEQ
tara:strand:- start:551 stop:736 length:186 start_codon:yes stop_codon:yes gene_type:complete